MSIFYVVPTSKGVGAGTLQSITRRSKNNRIVSIAKINFDIAFSFIELLTIISFNRFASEPD